MNVWHGFFLVLVLWNVTFCLSFHIKLHRVWYQVVYLKDINWLYFWNLLIFYSSKPLDNDFYQQSILILSHNWKWIAPYQLYYYCLQKLISKGNLFRIITNCVIISLIQTLVKMVTSNQRPCQADFRHFSQY